MTDAILYDLALERAKRRHHPIPWLMLGWNVWTFWINFHLSLLKGFHHDQT